jgi:anti-sigma regulatory factor (Ser/Thr protein kinase)
MLFHQHSGDSVVATMAAALQLDAIEHPLDNGAVLTVLIDQRRQRSLHAEVVQSRHALGIVSRLLQPDHLGPVHGMNLAFWVQPAGPLGGDFVDLVALDNGKHALILGDAVGSGAEAWALAATARWFLRASLWTTTSLREAVERANALLCREFSQNRFLSAQVVLIEPDRRLTIVSAGYPPPLMLRGSVSAELQLQENVPLGLDVNHLFFAREVELQDGDRMVFYSDGLSEHRDADGSFFGVDRILRASLGTTGSALHSIRAEARRFCDEFVDDVTLVTLQAYAKVQPSLTLHFPPDAKRIRSVRKAFEAAAQRAHLSGIALEEFTIAVGEALSNAVLHGSVPGRDNTIEARYWEEPTAIGVQVRSSATGWQLPARGSKVSGRGISLMHAFADKLSIEQDPQGTTVTLYKNFGR